MAEFPQLAGVATADLADEIKGEGGFRASYINWSRTMNLLRDHAPGWVPEIVRREDGCSIFKAPVGGFMLIRFVHHDGTVTPPVPQAVMDYRNKAIPYEKITARDITDTHRRGVCLAAAMLFGLAYELWAKMELETGMGDGEHPPAPPPPEPVPDPPKPEDFIAKLPSPEIVNKELLDEYRRSIDKEHKDEGAEILDEMVALQERHTNDEILMLHCFFADHILHQASDFNIHQTKNCYKKVRSATLPLRIKDPMLEFLEVKGKSLAGK